MTFKTDLSLDFIVLDTVPFDAYILDAFVFAIDKTTNKSVPIVTFAAGDGPDNFVLSSIAFQTKNAWTYDSGAGPTTIVVESSMIEVTVKRSQLAQAFTVCLLLINAALTAGSVYVTLLVIVRTEGVNDAILLLPVTTVLTIPALRGLYVGSPPFGIYLGTSPALGPSPRTDAALRYTRVLLANDDSRGVLHGTVIHGCCAARTGPTNLPRGQRRLHQQDPK